MDRKLTRFPQAMAAGAFGGLVNSLAVWSFGALGVNAMLGARLAPELTVGWLAPRLLFGGLWGLLFLLPWRAGSLYLSAAFYSLPPTLYMLFKVLPQAGAGQAGLRLGWSMPFLVLFFNLVWAFSAAFALRRMGWKPDRHV